MSHPDGAEAAQWVKDEISRLRALSYQELLRYEGHALHCEMLSHNGRVLMRETQVFWDKDENGPLRSVVDVCEPKPGWVSSIVSESFIRAPDGSFIDEPA